ncbi:hypothetical protein J6590_081290 [Homalodisca vitripennis]|nr:hypothetical protein J6590_081290 [Homalodisca vitripennis]
MADFTIVELAAIAIALDDEEIENKRKKRRIWVHDLWKKRESQGEFITLFKGLMDDETKFFKYFRMTSETFHILLGKVEVHLRKQDTHWRKSVTPRERLAVCLR